jgi:carboxyl-terminal processing protease
VLRESLDKMYAHRAAKLARNGLDENALFADAERTLLAATTWADYDAAIYNALARFHDGHLSYKPPPSAAPKQGYAGWSLGIATQLGQGHLLVASVEPGSSAATAGVTAGDEIISIDGTTAADALASAGRSRAVSRPESAMTTFAHTWTTVLYAKDAAPRARAIHVARRGGGALDVAIAPQPVPKSPHDAISLAHDGDVAIVTVRSLEGGKDRAKLFDDTLALARSSPAVVIDLRGDRGGVDLVGYQLVADLAEGMASLGTFRVLVAPETIARRPKWKNLAGTGDALGFSPAQPITVHALDHGYKGKVAVVVDAACASTCEVVTAALRADLHAVVIGETTGGSSGAPVTIVLPASRATVGIPTWDLTSAEGKPIEDIGVIPDVVVDPTPDALAAGTDLPLKTAIDRVRTP